jgi:cellulose synthase operon protein C
MFNIKRTLGLLGFLILVSPAAWPVDDLMSRQMADQAREWSQKGRDDLAAPVWRRVLSVEPAHPEALIRLGLIEARMGNLKEAQSLYQRASRLSPSPKGLKTLFQALNPTEEIVPTPKAALKGVPPESVKKEIPVKSGKKVQESIVANVSAPAVNRELKVRTEPKVNGEPKLSVEPIASTGKWEERRLGLEKATQDHPGDARHLLALASHLALRESTRREAVRQLEALNSSSLRSSEIKKPWKKALLDLTPQQGDQALFKSYLTRHPTSTSVLRRLNNLDGKEISKPNRAKSKDQSDKSGQQNTQPSDPALKTTCGNAPCK